MRREGVRAWLASGVKLALGERQYPPGVDWEEKLHFLPCLHLLLGLVPFTLSGLNISRSEKCFCQLLCQGRLSRGVITKNGVSASLSPVQKLPQRPPSLQGN